MYEDTQQTELPQLTSLVDLSVAEAFRILAAQNMVAVTGEFGDDEGAPLAAIAMFRGENTREYLAAIEGVNQALKVQTVEQVVGHAPAVSKEN